MAEREKVIRGLECHATKGFVACQDCPYYPDELIYEDDDDMEGTICEEKLAADAIALLKEQEARVMTTEELTQIEPWTVYWGEGFNVRNLWPMAFTAEAIQNTDEGYLKNSYGRAYELDLYNKEVMGWRIWTARPTEEQRKAVLWDG